jgi:hypothetical protein
MESGSVAIKSGMFESELLQVSDLGRGFHKSVSAAGTQPTRNPICSIRQIRQLRPCFPRLFGDSHIVGGDGYRSRHRSTALQSGWKSVARTSRTENLLFSYFFMHAVSARGFMHLIAPVCPAPRHDDIVRRVAICIRSPAHQIRSICWTVRKRLAPCVAKNRLCDF